MTPLALRLVLLAVFMAIPSCGPLGKQFAVDLVACAAGQFPGMVSDIAPEVATALQGSGTDWSNEIVSLESHGVNFAICAIEDGLALLSKRSTSAMDAKMLAARQLGVDRARSYLASKGVTLRGAAPETGSGKPPDGGAAP